MVERRARHELGRAQQRLHLVDGFLAAMAHLDAVVQVGCCGWVGWIYKHSSHLLISAWATPGLRQPVPRLTECSQPIPPSMVAPPYSPQC